MINFSGTKQGRKRDNTNYQISEIKGKTSLYISKTLKIIKRILWTM